MRIKSGHLGSGCKCDPLNYECRMSPCGWSKRDIVVRQDLSRCYSTMDLQQSFAASFFIYIYFSVF